MHLANIALSSAKSFSKNKVRSDYVVYFPSLEWFNGGFSGS